MKYFPTKPYFYREVISAFIASAASPDIILLQAIDPTEPL